MDIPQSSGLENALQYGTANVESTSRRRRRKRRGLDDDGANAGDAAGGLVNHEPASGKTSRSGSVVVTTAHGAQVGGNGEQPQKSGERQLLMSEVGTPSIGESTPQEGRRRSSATAGVPTGGLDVGGGSDAGEQTGGGIGTGGTSGTGDQAVGLDSASGAPAPPGAPRTGGVRRRRGRGSVVVTDADDNDGPAPQSQAQAQQQQQQQGTGVGIKEGVAGGLSTTLVGGTLTRSISSISGAVAALVPVKKVKRAATSLRGQYHPPVAHGHRDVETEVLGSLPLQLALFMNWYFAFVFVILEIAVQIWKLRTFDVGAGGTVVPLVIAVVFALLESFRVQLGNTVNLNENLPQVSAFMLLCIIVSGLVVYLWLIQPFALPFEEVMSIIMVGFVAFELVAITFLSRKLNFAQDTRFFLQNIGIA